jgi:hypothetical protein
MDVTTTNDIRHRLHRYDMAVQETRDHAPERSSFGQYRAGAPYFEQYPLRAALDIDDDASCDAVILREYWEEYDRITQDLENFERAAGRAYREELYKDLTVYAEMHRTAICCHELGMGDMNEIASPSLRVDIGILIWELHLEFPLADLEYEVTLLDTALRHICEAERSAPTVLPVPWQQYSRSRIKKERAGAR